MVTEETELMKKLVALCHEAKIPAVITLCHDQDKPKEMVTETHICAKFPDAGFKGVHDAMLETSYKRDMSSIESMLDYILKNG